MPVHDKSQDRDQSLELTLRQELAAAGPVNDWSVRS